MLGLPLNRPLLRVANACDVEGGGAGRGAALATALAAGGTGGRPRLTDVHVGLPPPPVKGSVHTVQGSYDYYHYMQVITGLDCFAVASWRFPAHCKAASQVARLPFDLSPGRWQPD